MKHILENLIESFVLHNLKLFTRKQYFGKDIVTFSIFDVSAKSLFLADVLL